jgi:hypothetical protein
VLACLSQSGNGISGTRLFSRLQESPFTLGMPVPTPVAVAFLGMHGYKCHVVVFRHGNDLEQSHIMGIAQALVLTSTDIGDSLK